ncbi:MAG: Glucose-responsive transcription factor [Trizodia sp. TS-e1964]|nr:MAG: Glucose-responsive transcription factor [Trizodia sp. TS-e1964]
MNVSQSYPSPTIDGHGPFFTPQAGLTETLSDASDIISPSQPLPLSDQFDLGSADAPNNGGAYGDPNAPRKRSKVSRACDECRRKKIRCDATSESAEEMCSSCKRVGTNCQFSRVPMKRGPSKGYIKELADRLITLENSIQPSGAETHYGALADGEISPRGVDADFSPPPQSASGSRYTRKRTHSASNDVQSQIYLQNQAGRSGERHPSLAGWTPQDPPRHLPHPASTIHKPPQTPQSSSSTSDINHGQSAFRPHFSPNGMAQPFWRHGPHDVIPRASINLPYDSNDLRPAEGDQSDEILEWDDKTIDEYYRIIDPTFPLLPKSKARLRSRLANCPVTLREAFLEVLYATVRSFPSSNIPAAPDFLATKRAIDLITASQFENAATRTMSTNLIYLQTMILMALEADNHGPATMRGQLGPPRAVWLGSAVGMAYFLKLHIIRYREKFSDADHDSDAKLARRIWFVLVTLDRWHASSTSSPVLIPDTSVVLLPEDQILLGDSAFHLARLSCIIGHLAEIFVAADDVMAPSSSSAPLIGKLLQGEMERFRETIDNFMDSLNIVHLCYWHVNLLMKHHTSTSEPLDLIGPALHMASILNSPNTPITPLSHHFAALAALTLVELSEIPETKDEAWKGIQVLSDALDKRRSLSSRQESMGWDTAVRELIYKKRLQVKASAAAAAAIASGVSSATSGGGSGGSTNVNTGLQHLADLAVGERDTNNNASVPAAESASSAPLAIVERTSAVYDPSALTRFGYLTMLVQDNIRC